MNHKCFFSSIGDTEPPAYEATEEGSVSHFATPTKGGVVNVITPRKTKMETRLVISPTRAGKSKATPSKDHVTPTKVAVTATQASETPANAEDSEVNQRRTRSGALTTPTKQTTPRKRSKLTSATPTKVSSTPTKANLTTPPKIEGRRTRSGALTTPSKLLTEVTPTKASSTTPKKVIFTGKTYSKEAGNVKKTPSKSILKPSPAKSTVSVADMFDVSPEADTPLGRVSSIHSCNTSESTKVPNSPIRQRSELGASEKREVKTPSKRAEETNAGLFIEAQLKAKKKDYNDFIKNLRSGHLERAKESGSLQKHESVDSWGEVKGPAKDKSESRTNRLSRSKRKSAEKTDDCEPEVPTDPTSDATKVNTESNSPEKQAPKPSFESPRSSSRNKKATFRLGIDDIAIQDVISPGKVTKVGKAPQAVPAKPLTVPAEYMQAYKMSETARKTSREPSLEPKKPEKAIETDKTGQSEDAKVVIRPRIKKRASLDKHKTPTVPEETDDKRTRSASLDKPAELSNTSKRASRSSRKDPEGPKTPEKSQPIYEPSKRRSSRSNSSRRQHEMDTKTPEKTQQVPEQDVTPVRPSRKKLVTQRFGIDNMTLSDVISPSGKGMGTPKHKSGDTMAILGTPSTPKSTKGIPNTVKSRQKTPTKIVLDEDVPDTIRDLYSVAESLVGSDNEISFNRRAATPSLKPENDWTSEINESPQGAITIRIKRQGGSNGSTPKSNRKGMTPRPLFQQMARVSRRQSMEIGMSPGKLNKLMMQSPSPKKKVPPLKMKVCLTQLNGLPILTFRQ